MGELEVVGQRDQDPIVEPARLARRVARHRRARFRFPRCDTRAGRPGLGDRGRGSPRGTRRAPRVRSCRARFRVRRTEFKAAAARTSGSTSLVPAPTPMATRRSRPVAPTARWSPMARASRFPSALGATRLEPLPRTMATRGPPSMHTWSPESHATFHAPQRQSPQQVVAFQLHARARRRLDVHAGDDGVARAGRPRAAFGDGGRGGCPVAVRVLVARPPVVLRPGGGSRARPVWRSDALDGPPPLSVQRTPSPCHCGTPHPPGPHHGAWPSVLKLPGCEVVGQVDCAMQAKSDEISGPVQKDWGKARLMCW